MIYNVYTKERNPSFVGTVEADDGEAANKHFADKYSTENLVACAHPNRSGKQLLVVYPADVAVTMLILMVRHGKKFPSLSPRSTTEENYTGLIFDVSEAGAIYHYLPGSVTQELNQSDAVLLAALKD